MMDFLKGLFRKKAIEPENPTTANGETDQSARIIVLQGEITGDKLVKFVNLDVNLESDDFSWHKNVADQKVKLYGIEDLKGMSYEKATEVLFEEDQYVFQLVLAQWLNFNVKKAIKAGQESADITDIFNSDFSEDGEIFPHEEIREKLMTRFEILEDSEAELKVRLNCSLNS